MQNVMQALYLTRNARGLPASARRYNKVNLKTEIMIEDLYDKVNAILAKQSALEKKLQEQEDPTKS